MKHDSNRIGPDENPRGETRDDDKNTFPMYKRLRFSRTEKRKIRQRIFLASPVIFALARAFNLTAIMGRMRFERGAKCVCECTPSLPQHSTCSVHDAEHARLCRRVVNLLLRRAHGFLPRDRLERLSLRLPLHPLHLVAVEKSRLGLLGDPARGSKEGLGEGTLISRKGR